MNIIQCKMCKKPFHSIGGKVCPDCLKKIDQDFFVVRDYIYDNQGADIDTVSEETGVEKAVILHLLKEGRLTLATPGGAGGSMLMCEVCKKPIVSGRMCEVCKNKVASTMQKNVDGNKPPPEKKQTEASKYSSKMHTRHDRNEK